MKCLLILFSFALLHADEPALQNLIDSIANCPAYPTRFAGPSWINLECVTERLAHFTPVEPLHASIQKCPVLHRRLKLKAERRVRRDCILEQLRNLESHR